MLLNFGAPVAVQASAFTAPWGLHTSVSNVRRRHAIDGPHCLARVCRGSANGEPSLRDLAFSAWALMRVFPRCPGDDSGVPAAREGAIDARDSDAVMAHVRREDVEGG